MKFCCRLIIIAVPVVVGLILVSMAVGGSYDESSRRREGFAWRPHFVLHSCKSRKSRSFLPNLFDAPFVNCQGSAILKLLKFGCLQAFLFLGAFFLLGVRSFWSSLMRVMLLIYADVETVKDKASWCVIPEVGCWKLLAEIVKPKLQDYDPNRGWQFGSWGRFGGVE